MTTESFTPTSPKVIAGTGPYPISHEYSAATDLRAYAEAPDGTVVEIDPAELIIDPLASESTGNLTLSAAIAAAHAGETLYIHRDTDLEWGWIGNQSAREKGLEINADQLTRAAQDQRTQAARSLRVLDGEVKPYQPTDGKVPIWNAAAGGFVDGPFSEDIVNAQSWAETADAHRLAAAASASAAAAYAPYADRATAIAATVPAPVLRIAVLAAGLTLSYVSDAAGTALTTDAGARKWSPDGVARPEHFAENTVPGTTDMTAAIQAALTFGDTVADGVYRTTAEIDIPSDRRLSGTGSIVLAGPDGTFHFDMNGVTGSSITGLTFTGSASASVTGRAIRINGSTGCQVIGCSFTDIEGTAVDLTNTSSHCLISDNTITDCSGFGVRVGSNSHSNTIAHNRTDANDFELIGITQSSWGNNVIGNRASGTGDNGISVSGYDNAVTGNVCIGNDGAGIYVWGSGNTITGNTCLNNNQMGSIWPGIGSSANYGGTGQGNTIAGNTCDDTQAVATQQNGVRISGNSYNSWQPATGYTAGVSYVINGLNIYLATTTGTSGGTAPVHTSGEVSDGGVTWRFTRSFYLAAKSWYNVVTGNQTLRGASTDTLDVDNWQGNILHGAEGESATSITQRMAAGVMDLSAFTDFALNAGVQYLLKVNGAIEWRMDSNNFFPETANGSSIGKATRRVYQVHAEEFHAGTGASTVKVVGAQQAAIADSVGSDEVAKINAILAALRAHGLIAT